MSLRDPFPGPTGRSGPAARVGRNGARPSDHGAVGRVGIVNRGPRMVSTRCKDHLREIFLAGVRAADPAEAVRRALRLEGDTLFAGRLGIRLEEVERVWIVGAGKAAAPMARAAEEILQDRLSGGRIVVKDGHLCPLDRIELFEAGHPVPDERGVEATRKILELVDRAGPRDLVLCLLSGGGSALLVDPVEGVTLEAKQAVTRELLACGAHIGEVNTVRKHLSRVKGGWLARRARPAAVAALILSDVVGDPLDAIASGPTAPDPTTFADSQAILDRYGLARKPPASVLGVLERGAKGEIPETPKPGDPVFSGVVNEIVANNLGAVSASARKARELGYKPLILSTRVEGETREVARVHGAVYREARASGHPIGPPACILSGGETTVTLKGTGKGGRNQEFALAVAVDIQGESGLCFLSAGTDGTDGPTDAAGAFCDGGTVARARSLGMEAAEYLDRNASYTFFEKLGDLLKTGPTNTNVMDLRICLIRSS